MKLVKFILGLLVFAFCVAAASTDEVLTIKAAEFSKKTDFYVYDKNKQPLKNLKWYGKKTIPGKKYATCKTYGGNYRTVFYLGGKNYSEKINSSSTSGYAQICTEPNQIPTLEVLSDYPMAYIRFISYDKGKTGRKDEAYGKEGMLYFPCIDNYKNFDTKFAKYHLRCEYPE
jgi:hypothetical protein